LRQAEADLAQGLSIAQVCQKLGVSEQTLQRWRNRYGGLQADEAKRLKELASLPKDHSAREALVKLANRMACIVSEVRFSDASVARPDNMLKAAEPLKNQPLSEKRFIELLVSIHKLVPAESCGMVIALDRDGDDTGIHLEIRTLPRRDTAKEGTVHLCRHEEVVVDGRELLSSGAATVGVGQETQLVRQRYLVSILVCSMGVRQD